MSAITRRRFILAASGTTVAGLIGLPAGGRAATKAHVVVVGGGYGGAIAAKYIRKLDPHIAVTLIEKDKQFVSCPLSNEVLSGERDIASLTFGYDGLKSHGVKVVHDEVVDIDPEKRKVKTKGGSTFAYDRLVVSPGIDFRWEAIEGYGPDVAEKLPHAWKAGPQTLLLRKQITSMRDGDNVLIIAPPNPYRCPPGPYERAAQIAHYLKAHKPKSKVIILDPKDKFSKQGLFTAGWKKFYGDRIQWIGGFAGGTVESVDPKKMTVQAEVETFKGGVINVIPPQKAGPIAHKAGLTDDSGWCPVDQKTFESTKHPNIHVIGDSCIAGKMPKSGYAANSQGKVCAVAVVAALNGEPVPQPSYINTCYSLIAPDYGISVAAVYRLQDGKIVPVKGAGGLSPTQAPEHVREMEAMHARSWFRNITSDMFA